MAKRGIYRRRHRKDGNSDLLVAYLRSAGVSVELIGEPTDAACAWGLVTDLVEFKMPDGTLNDDQEAFYLRWQGRKVVIRTLDEAKQYVSSLHHRSARLGASSRQDGAS